MRRFELIPCNGRKSFYGKAFVDEMENGEVVLMSYNTPVAKIDKNRRFVRLWDGYSVTTMHHVNAFLDVYNIPGGGKAWWDKQSIA